MASRRFINETFPVERGTQRFRELIVYISKRCERDASFGAGKLNKILYHADFRAFERFGIPITGVRYQRLPQGPAPKSLPVIRRQLQEEGVIELVKVDLGQGYEQHRTIAKREPIMRFFTADEIAVVDEVIAELWSQTARDVSDASHDVRWRVLQHKDPVPYEFAYLSDEPVSESEEARTRELANKFGWATAGT